MRTTRLCRAVWLLKPCVLLSIDGIISCFSWNRNKGGHTAPFVTVEKVAERHFFELLRVLPLALAPGRQNPQSTKTYGFSSVLTHMSSEPD